MQGGHGDRQPQRGPSWLSTSYSLKREACRFKGLVVESRRMAAKPKTRGKAAKLVICRVTYSDPSSRKFGTIDVAVIDPDRPNAFIYSIVHIDGELQGIEVYPCLPLEEPTLEAVMRLFEAEAQRIGESLSIICRENMSFQDVGDMVKADFMDTGKAALAMVQIVGCFSMVA